MIFQFHFYLSLFHVLHFMSILAYIFCIIHDLGAVNPLFYLLGKFHPGLFFYILYCLIVHLWSFSKLFLSSHWRSTITISITIFGFSMKDILEGLGGSQP